MKYRKYRDASNRLTVSVEDMPSMAYRIYRWRICRKFQLVKTGEYVKGFNEKFQVFSSSEGKVSIDWDTWSGFTVTAMTSESEELVQKIWNWLHKD